MLRNNNSRFIRMLSLQCLKANKIRNMIAIFAIILTTVLFTSVTTVLEGAQQTIREQQIRQSGIRFMMSMKYMSEETSEKFENNPAFSELGKLQYLGDVVNDELQKIQTDFAWADENFLDGAYVELKEGKLPQKEDEVLADTVVLDLLGIPGKLGETLHFSYRVNGELRECDLKVAGIYQGDNNELTSTLYISRAFLESETKGLEMPSDGRVGAGTVLLYGSFPSAENLEAKRAQVLTEAGFDPQAKVGEEGFLRSNINPAYQQNAGVDGGVIAAGAALALIIILAGYLIISNVFRISVLKDLRMYGQLKTIGTSPKQLQRLLEQQANLLNLIGIPIGLCLGYFLGMALLPGIMKMSAYTDVQRVRPRLWIFVVSAIFAFVTVWISLRRPAKMMSRMSPVQALRYQGTQEGKKKQKGGRESRARILQMAVSGVADHKGKTFFVVLSLSLSVVLLNSVINYVGCFDQKTYVEGMSGADFVVSNLALGIGDESETKVIPREFLDEISRQPGLEKNGSVYCYQAPDDVMADLNNDEELRDHYDGISTVKILTVNGEPYPEEYAMELGEMLYGFDEKMFERCKVVDGELDMEKLATGRYIVQATHFINNNIDYLEDAFTMKPGDKMTGEIGGVALEYEVLANVVVMNDLMSFMSSGEPAVLILPSEEYLRQFPGRLPIHYVMDAKEGRYDEISQFLKEYEARPQANVKYQSRTGYIEEFKEIKSTYSMVGIILSAIFGVIGILNLVNVTLTNAVSRQREFAIMQSIGMTKRQLRKMFVLEAVMYAVIAGVLSLVLASILSLTAVRAITSMMWFSVYRFDLVPAFMLIPVFVVAAGLIALAVDWVWNHGSVVERLRKSK